MVPLSARNLIYGCQDAGENQRGTICFAFGIDADLHQSAVRLPANAEMPRAVVAPMSNGTDFRQET